MENNQVPEEETTSPETEYLLGSDANRERLQDSIAALRRGEVKQHDLIHPEK